MMYDSFVSEVDAQSYQSPENRSRIALMAERSQQIVHAHLPTILSGWCHVCQAIKPIDFRANFGLIVQSTGAFIPAYSKTGVCTDCLVSSRKRFAVELLRRFAPGKRLYMTEHVTRLRERLLADYPDLQSSEYLGEHNPGTIVDGIRHEDLHQLSFDENSFDAVMCLDVLEHVNDPTKCVAEIVRVLAPGGLAIITVPFFSDRQASVRRSEIVNGEIVHHLPAEFHGNPLGGGALVFWELSWDWVQDIAQGVSCTVKVLHYWSAFNLHLGTNRIAITVKKTG